MYPWSQNQHFFEPILTNPIFYVQPQYSPTSVSSSEAARVGKGLLCFGKAVHLTAHPLTLAIVHIDSLHTLPRAHSTVQRV